MKHRSQFTVQTFVTEPLQGSLTSETRTWFSGGPEPTTIPRKWTFWGNGLWSRRMKQHLNVLNVLDYYTQCITEFRALAIFFGSLILQFQNPESWKSFLKKNQWASMFTGSANVDHNALWLNDLFYTNHPIFHHQTSGFILVKSSFFYFDKWVTSFGV